VGLKGSSATLLLFQGLPTHCGLVCDHNHQDPSRCSRASVPGTIPPKPPIRARTWQVGHVLGSMVHGNTSSDFLYSPPARAVTTEGPKPSFMVTTYSNVERISAGAIHDVQHSGTSASISVANTPSAIVLPEIVIRQCCDSLRAIRISSTCL
jgi:hypothetical protein